MRKALKFCKKCGKAIYEESYYQNSDVEDNNFFHRDCLIKNGFKENGEFLVKKNGKRLCFEKVYYKKIELIEIATDLMREKHMDQVSEVVKSV